MKVFADMPHGFLNDTMPGRYRPKEAAQAWDMLRAFLGEAFSGQWHERVRWEFEGVSAHNYDFSKNVRLE
jgi:carboxymethylenebutenolidase